MKHFIDEPAFPVYAPIEDDPVFNDGMTMLDYFAAKALPLAIQMNKETNDSNIGEGGWCWEDEDHGHIARVAFEIARAMLIERQK